MVRRCREIRAKEKKERTGKKMAKAKKSGASHVEKVLGAAERGKGTKGAGNMRRIWRGTF